MKFKRSSGIFLHPTSLPGNYGIGDLGPKAFEWVDWLASTGCKLWQVLPLGPTGYGDSPYQSFSSFAGNPLLISLDSLLAEDLLEENDLKNCPVMDQTQVDFSIVMPWKYSLLEKAHNEFKKKSNSLAIDYKKFIDENSTWLDDYSLFMGIKEIEGGGSWEDWPEPYRRREPSTLREFVRTHSVIIHKYYFFQFLFFRQWQALHEHAKQKGISIIGDIPIFVAYDSADVWVHPELFTLGDDLRPTTVAGVPPDYFSPTGQLWGNPLYRWEKHQATGFQWWQERVSAALNLVDILRIDHFRGFAAYWEIPSGNPTAEYGKWQPGPGNKLFNALMHQFGKEIPIIAEDLGLITEDVISLRERFGFPGMKVLQFGFSGPDNPFLPHAYLSDCVVYTGTHDNDTTKGWFETAPEDEKDFAMRYLGCDATNFTLELIKEAWKSVAVFAIAPMQDLLDLGSSARMNFPSRLGGNWKWRMEDSALSAGLQSWIKEINWLYQR